MCVCVLGGGGWRERELRLASLFPGKGNVVRPTQGPAAPSVGQGRGEGGRPGPAAAIHHPQPSPSRSHPTPLNPGQESLSSSSPGRLPRPPQPERASGGGGAASSSPHSPFFLPATEGEGGGGGAKGVAVVVVALAGGGLFLPGRARRRGREGAPRASSPPGACLPARARSPTLHTRRSLRPLRRRPMRSSRQPASQPADQPWTAPQARSRPPACPPSSPRGPRLASATLALTFPTPPPQLPHEGDSARGAQRTAARLLSAAAARIPAHSPRARLRLRQQRPPPPGRSRPRPPRPRAARPRPSARGCPAPFPLPALPPAFFPPFVPSGQAGPSPSLG